MCAAQSPFWPGSDSWCRSSLRVQESNDHFSNNCRFFVFFQQAALCPDERLNRVALLTELTLHESATFSYFIISSSYFPNSCYPTEPISQQEVFLLIYLPTRTFSHQPIFPPGWFLTNLFSHQAVSNSENYPNQTSLIPQRKPFYCHVSLGL